MKAKRASIREAVYWIAHNDDPASGPDLEVLEHQMTVVLVADLFGLARTEVAKRVAQERKKSG
jgi:hypothetical protein